MVGKRFHSSAFSPIETLCLRHTKDRTMPIPTISFLESVTSHGILFERPDESQKVDASHCAGLGRQPESAL